MEEVNPLRAIREHMHWTLVRVAREAGVSKQLVISNEAAQYERPSDTLLDYYLLYRNEWEDAVDYNNLIRDYKAFQYAQRRSNYGVLTFPVNDRYPVGGSNPVNPFMFVCALSNIPTTRICKLYCVHQGLIHRLIHENNLMQSLPGVLKDALLDSGYSAETIAAFDSAFIEYKRSVREQVR